MIYEPTPENIRRASAILRDDGLVSFPTETVYGLGADAFNKNALAKIFEVKGRPKLDPLIIHVGTFEEISQVSEVDLNDPRITALSKLWPGPLTLVLPKKSTVPDLATSNLPTVAVRVPAHPVALALLREFGSPIAAPSANPFSYVSPTKAEHVDRMLGNKIEMVLDGGDCQIGLESTILSLVGSRPRLLRPGGVSLEALNELIGDILVEDKHEEILAPGMLPEHYSPRTKLKFINDVNLSEIDPDTTGAILFRTNAAVNRKGLKSIVSISQDGNLQQISHHLFSAIRDLDLLGLNLILVDSCPKEGLGLAIMDRLTRASKRA